MKIAIASSNGHDVDLHLGKANSLYIYEYLDDNTKFIEKRNVVIESNTKHQGSKVLEAVKDCDVLISVQYGMKSKFTAEEFNIKLVSDEGSIDEVLQRYIDHYNFMKN